MKLLCSSEKEGTLTFHNSTDVPGDYYAKWNKPVGNRDHMISLTYGV